MLITDLWQILRMLAFWNRSSSKYSSYKEIDTSRDLPHHASDEFTADSMEE